jgi:hypothetical protein
MRGTENLKQNAGNFLTKKRNGLLVANDFFPMAAHHVVILKNSRNVICFPAYKIKLYSFP